LGRSGPYCTILCVCKYLYNTYIVVASRVLYIVLVQAIHMSILSRARPPTLVVQRVHYIIIIIIITVVPRPCQDKTIAVLSKYSPGADNRRYYRVINVEKFFFRWQACTCCKHHTNTRARTHVPPATPAVVSGYRNNSVSTAREEHGSDNLVPHSATHAHTPRGKRCDGYFIIIIVVYRRSSS